MLMNTLGRDCSPASFFSRIIDDTRPASVAVGPQLNETKCTRCPNGFLILSRFNELVDFSLPDSVSGLTDFDAATARKNQFNVFMD